MNINRILIIDDSKTFLSYITEMLNDVPNISCLTHTDPRTAESVAENFLPDLILTDFEMPHLNGNQLCSIMKNNPKLSTTPIMMLTSNNSEDQLIKAIESGADDYLYKASRKEIVIIKIKSQLRYKNLINENIKVKQLEAVQALIATSNHEFNNALFISNGFIRKLFKLIPNEYKEILLKILDNNKRMEKVVQHLDQVKSIEFDSYGNKIKMLKI